MTLCNYCTKPFEARKGFFARAAIFCYGALRATAHLFRSLFVIVVASSSSRPRKTRGGTALLCALLCATTHFPVAARLPQSVSNSRTVGGHRQPLAAGVPLPPCCHRQPFALAGGRTFSCCCTFATIRFEFKSAEQGLGSSSSGLGVWHDDCAGQPLAPGMKPVTS